MAWKSSGSAEASWKNEGVGKKSRGKKQLQYVCFISWGDDQV